MKETPDDFEMDLSDAFEKFEKDYKNKFINIKNNKIYKPFIGFVDDEFKCMYLPKKYQYRIVYFYDIEEKT